MPTENAPEDETLFGGYIENRAKAVLILKAIRADGFLPQYLRQ